MSRENAIRDAMNEALEAALDAVDRQYTSRMYVAKEPRRLLIEHERADLFVRALHRLGYDVCEATS